MKNFSFDVIKNDKKARLGRIITPHGAINTPVFMPVGTLASVKTVSSEELETIESQIILANNYHLYLRPGVDVIAKAGGIHRFMNWSRPILTDSGGFQVFSLGKGSKMGGSFVKIFDDRVEFRSHLDGSRHVFTPENVIQMQEMIGADIIMCLDECAPHDSSHEYAEAAMDRTHDWADRCLKEHNKNKRLSNQGNYQALFGIVQGTIYSDLREKSVKYLAARDFDGIAIGGLSVGETKEEMKQILDDVEPHLPTNKPRYLMGVGSPEDLFEGVERGIDMFDCVLATRIARNGTIWTNGGKLNLNNAKFKKDFKPFEPTCDCLACRNYSRAYISHLIREKEVLGIRLTTIHNLRFLMNVMSEIRLAIDRGDFAEFKMKFLNKFNHDGKNSGIC